MYSIDQNWERAVQNHVRIMQARGAQTEKHGWETREFRDSFELYVHSCESFLDYISAHFESKAGFADFLKSEARSMFPADADRRLLDVYNWHVSDVNAVTDAQSLSSIYIYSYSVVTHAATLQQERAEVIAPALRLQSA